MDTGELIIIMILWEYDKLNFRRKAGVAREMKWHESRVKESGETKASGNFTELRGG